MTQSVSRRVHRPTRSAGDSSRPSMSTALRRDLEAQVEGRGPLRHGLARALFHRRQRLPDRAARRRRAANRARMSSAPSRSAASTAVPLTMRGGGTSQAGQAIGDGLQIDTSKYFNRLLEVNVARALGARRARHRARRAERRAAAARPAVRARHLDREPRHRRRHDGQQLERRALGAVRQDHRPRARAGRRAVGRLASSHFRPLDAARARRVCARRHARGAVLSRGAAAGARRTPTRSSGAIPKMLRRVGGYNLDAFVDPRRSRST